MYINKVNKRKWNSGFILGIAMIAISVMLTLSIAIAILLVRDLKQSNVSYDTKLAISLASSAILCSESIFKNFRNASNTSSMFPTSTANVVSHFSATAFPDVDPRTVGCFNVPIFLDGLVTSGTMTTSTSTSDYKVNAELATSTVSSYRNGAFYKVKIERNDFDRRACVELEVHATSTGATLAIGRGRVPCDNAVRVERVIVKRFD